MSVEPLFVVVFSEFSEKLKHNFNDELRVTNDELRMTNDELRMTNDELRMTNDELRDSPRTPEGGQAAKAIAICLNGNK